MERLTKKTCYGYTVIGTDGLMANNAYVKNKMIAATRKLGKLEDAEEEKENRQIVYLEALKKFGLESQNSVAIEEMSELTKEICKYGRGKRDIESLVDEIADVTIMMEQLTLFYGVSELVNDRMSYKINRLKERMEDNGNG